jgi:fused signal recognition particle receptor
LDSSTVIYIVIGIAVVAAIYFLFFRAKQVPPAEEKKPLEPKREKEPAPARPKEKEKESIRPAGEAPRRPLPSKPPPPEALASEHVLPVDDSERKQPKARQLDKEEVAGLRKGLSAARGGFIARLTALFTGKKEFDPALLEQLEEVMLTSDVGPKTTRDILERLRQRLDKNEIKDADGAWAALREEATRILGLPGGKIRFSGKPTVVLMVGVNGVGKTTTIGKLATHYNADGKKVMLAAGDTFRAAAVQQLEVWGKRVNADVVKGKEGADPGAVAFDATTKAKEGGADLLLVDTAGRLHTKTPLMDEIKKVKKTIAKALDGAPHETLLVVDATTGQNALNQAQMFKDAIDLTGIILTKLDGTAKGGIVLGICDELKIPVRYIGLGERAEDLREFHPEEFVEALFGQRGDEAAAA